MIIDIWIIRENFLQPYDILVRCEELQVSLNVTETSSLNQTSSHHYQPFTKLLDSVQHSRVLQALIFIHPGLHLKHKARQMQRDSAMHHKYEISHLKRLTIGNDCQGHSMSSQLLLLERLYTSITFFQ